VILTDFLKAGNIIIDCKVADKWEVIKLLAANLVKTKSIPKENEEFIISALLERENSMSTGIGNGLAVPHCSTDLVENTAIAIAIHHDGLNFNSIDDRSVNIIIMMIFPKSGGMRHLKLLAEIAKIMSNESLKQRILSSKKPADIISNLSGI